ncbi:MAG: hypothetical protein ABSC18_05215 [Verrucomicrobiota bacterium]|jgi:hypothetical protein
MTRNEQFGDSYLAIVLDMSDNTHCEIIVRANDHVEASRCALLDRLRTAEAYEGDEEPGIEQGDNAGSGCDEFSCDELKGFAVIAVYDVTEVRLLLRNLESGGSQCA